VASLPPATPPSNHPRPTTRCERELPNFSVRRPFPSTISHAPPAPPPMSCKSFCWNWNWPAAWSAMAVERCPSPRRCPFASR
jgi:hypothetical protein